MRFFATKEGIWEFLQNMGYKLCTMILPLNAKQLSMLHSFWFIDGLITIGHVNECPIMHHFGNSRHTQPMIPYKVLTEYSWEFHCKILLRECCQQHALLHWTFGAWKIFLTIAHLEGPKPYDWLRLLPVCYNMQCTFYFLN